MAWLSSGNVPLFPQRQNQYDHCRDQVLRLRSMGKSLSWRSIRQEVEDKITGWRATAARLTAMISQFGLYGDFPPGFLEMDDE